VTDLEQAGGRPVPAPALAAAPQAHSRGPDIHAAAAAAGIVLSTVGLTRGAGLASGLPVAPVVVPPQLTVDQRVYSVEVNGAVQKIQ
jgi:hypothetical protein